jgi:hypothetical protein
VCGYLSGRDYVMESGHGPLWMVSKETETYRGEFRLF